jgi:hypothetical protein
MTQNTGARYEITIDGKPRSYRDSRPIAIEAARHLNSKNPNAKIVVRDLETDHHQPATAQAAIGGTDPPI